MANPFDQFDAAEANPFDKFDAPAEPVDERAKRYEELKAEAKARTAAGEDPWWHAIPGLFGDPIGVTDELYGGAAAAGEFIKAPFKKGFWSGETTGLMDRAGKAYDETAMRTRALRDVRRERFGIVPEILGGLGPLTGAARSVAQLPTWAGRARQSAKIGGGFGAATGFAQGEDGVTNRAAGALKAGALGTILGPAISEVAVPAAIGLGRGIRSGAQYARGAVASSRDPAQAAIENVADRMVASGVQPAAVRAQISPATSANLQRRGFSEDDIANIVSRGLRGDSPAQIGADYGINAGTVTRYVNAYRQANPTPMNIIDVAKEVAGEGASAPLTRLGRATYSLAGDESGEAAQRLIGRQEGQAGRVSNIVQRSVAGGDFEATRAAGLQRLRNEANAAYRQFRAEPDLAISELDDLMADPLFYQANIAAQRQARVEVIRRNQEARRTGGRQEPVPDVDPDVQVFSPEHLDLIQRQLRIAGEGHVDTQAARHAQNLRQVFLDRIEQHYPTFRDIRRNYATGMGEFGEEGALEAGAALTTRLGAPAREALRGFDDMTPAQQELFRLGFARKLMDMAANPQIGGAVANQFQTTAVREIVERLYPAANRQLHQQGQQLLRDLRREAITTKTKNDVLMGARTAELQSDMGRLMEGAQTAADVATGRWGRVLENLATRLSTQLTRQGSREVLRLLTETDPAQLLPVLNRLAQAATTTAQRQAYVAAIRDLRNIGSRDTSAVTGIGMGRANAERPTEERAMQAAKLRALGAR